MQSSKQITLGRKSDHDSVDVDLLLEGPAHKVSRRQGTIKLRSNGDFFITNEGKRPLFIDGIPLLHGNKTKLNNNCTIEVSSINCVFNLCEKSLNFTAKNAILIDWVKIIFRLRDFVLCS